jgi:aminoglycoside 6-adenylyltransferase
MDDFLERVVSWARNKKDIKALIAVGSRARTSKPADRWSDYDLVMIVDNPEIYIKNTSWLDGLGHIVLSFIEKCALDDSFEHRVLFDNGRDVDFIIEPLAVVKAFTTGEVSPDVLDVYNRGYLVLLDTIGISPTLQKLTSITPQKNIPPAPDLFTNTIHDFFFHCVWTVKKLMRGELWIAKHCLNGYLQKNCLLPMIEWHTRTHNTESTDTWFSGRFLETWADKEIIGRLNEIDARYDPGDIIRALDTMMTLFDDLARRTAVKLGYSYAHALFKWTRAWIQKTVR